MTAVRRIISAGLTATLLWAGGAIAEYQSHESIRAAAARFMTAEAAGAHGPDFELNVEVSRLDARLRLRSCDAPLETFLPPGGRTSGGTTVGVRCSAPAPWSLYVPVTVSVTGEVLVAARSLPRGSMLTASDLRLERRDVGSLHGGYLSDAEAARDMVTRRALTPGIVITPQMLEPPRLVQRGQRVVLLAESGAFSVRVEGEALADAARGERVQVRNLSSRRIVEGLVLSAGVVGVSM